MKSKNNAVVWFEIPVTDMGRAVKFYETVLDVKLDRRMMGEMEMAMFPFASDAMGAAGSLVMQNEWYMPSESGTLVYFSSRSGDLSNEIGRVEKAGGKVLMPRKEISKEYGFMAVIRDSEGNRIALHSM